MFDFKYWFEGIVGTCELIVSKDAFRRAWILGDKSVTSIHYYLELFEQLMGDLHLEECIGQFAEELQQIGATEAVTELAKGLRKLDERIEGNRDLQDPEKLLASPEWASFRIAARRVIELPGVKSYRTNRTDITL